MWTKIVDLIKKLFGASPAIPSVGGGIVSAVGAGLSLADDVVKGNNDQRLMKGGAAEQRDVTNAEVLHDLTAGNAAAHDSGVIGVVRGRDEVP